MSRGFSFKQRMGLDSQPGGQMGRALCCAFRRSFPPKPAVAKKCPHRLAGRRSNHIVVAPIEQITSSAGLIIERVGVLNETRVCRGLRE